MTLTATFMYPNNLGTTGIHYPKRPQGMRKDRLRPISVEFKGDFSVASPGVIGWKRQCLEACDIGIPPIIDIEDIQSATRHEDGIFTFNCGKHDCIAGPTKGWFDQLNMDDNDDPFIESDETNGLEPLPCKPLNPRAGWEAAADILATAGVRTTNDIQHGGNHYKKCMIQPWDYILSNNIPYMEACVIRYVTRWRDKGGIEDLEKAKHYLEKLIEHEQSKKRTKKSMG